MVIRKNKPGIYKAYGDVSSADKLGYHSCEEYERRLNIIKSDIGSKTLTDLYSDKTIVGPVLDSGYKPVIMTTAKERFDRITGSKALQGAILGK